VLVPVVVVSVRVDVLVRVVMAVIVRMVVLAAVVVMVVLIVPVVVVVLMVVNVVCVLSGFLPQRQRADGDQDEQGDPAEQDGREELRRQDVFQLRLAVGAAQPVHHDRHPTHRPAGRDGAELVEVVGAVVNVFVVVCHCYAPSERRAV